MNAKQKIHHAKLNQWIGLFKEQADSGLTVRQWWIVSRFFRKINFSRLAADS